MTEPVRVERRGPVLVVTLDRPAKRNAVNSAVTAGLDAAFARLEADPELRAGVLAAEGPVFCAGTDLADGAGPPTADGGEYGLIRRARTKPVVAAVEGPALGGGFELVLACDLVVASGTAWFALPETTRGRVPNAGGLFRGADRLPRNVAVELMLTGARLDAARGRRFGLVNRLVEPGEASAAALLLAHEVCGAAPTAVTAVLTALAEQDRDREAAGWHATAGAVAATVDSADRAEGDAAFAERRAPSWALADGDRAR